MPRPGAHSPRRARSPRHSAPALPSTTGVGPRGMTGDGSPGLDRGGEGSHRNRSYEPAPRPPTPRPETLTAASPSGPGAGFSSPQRDSRWDPACHCSLEMVLVALEDVGPVLSQEVGAAPDTVTSPSHLWPPRVPSPGSCPSPPPRGLISDPDPAQGHPRGTERSSHDRANKCRKSQAEARPSTDTTARGADRGARAPGRSGRPGLRASSGTREGHLTCLGLSLPTRRACGAGMKEEKGLPGMLGATRVGPGFICLHPGPGTSPDPREDPGRGTVPQAHGTKPGTRLLSWPHRQGTPSTFRRPQRARGGAPPFLVGSISAFSTEAPWGGGGHRTEKRGGGEAGQPAQDQGPNLP